MTPVEFLPEAVKVGGASRAARRRMYGFNLPRVSVPPLLEGGENAHYSFLIRKIYQSYSLPQSNVTLVLQITKCAR